MSARLDSLLDAGRRAEIARNEADMGIAAPAQFTEADLVAADLQYLATQRERIARRVAETAALERAFVARRGWSL